MSYALQNLQKHTPFEAVHMVLHRSFKHLKLFRNSTRLKTLFQPQDDENIDKTDLKPYVTNSFTDLEKGMTVLFNPTLPI